MLRSRIVTAGPGSIEFPRSPNPIVRASDLVFVHFERPDLERAVQYLRDFGLILVSKSEKELYLRGTEPRPYVYRVTLGPKSSVRGVGPFRRNARRSSQALAGV